MKTVHSALAGRGMHLSLPEMPAARVASRQVSPHQDRRRMIDAISITTPSPTMSTDRTSSLNPLSNVNAPKAMTDKLRAI